MFILEIVTRTEFKKQDRNLSFPEGNGLSPKKQNNIKDNNTDKFEKSSEVTLITAAPEEDPIARRLRELSTPTKELQTQPIEEDPIAKKLRELSTPTKELQTQTIEEDPMAKRIRELSTPTKELQTQIKEEEDPIARRLRQLAHEGNSPDGNTTSLNPYPTRKLQLISATVPTYAAIVSIKDSFTTSATSSNNNKAVSTLQNTATNVKNFVFKLKPMQSLIASINQSKAAFVSSYISTPTTAPPAATAAAPAATTAATTVAQVVPKVGIISRLGSFFSWLCKRLPVIGGVASGYNVWTDYDIAKELNNPLDKAEALKKNGKLGKLNKDFKDKDKIATELEQKFKQHPTDTKIKKASGNARAAANIAKKELDDANKIIEDAKKIDKEQAKIARENFNWNVGLTGTGATIGFVLGGIAGAGIFSPITALLGAAIGASVGNLAAHIVNNSLVRSAWTGTYNGLKAAWNRVTN